MIDLQFVGNQKFCPFLLASLPALHIKSRLIDEKNFYNISLLLCNVKLCRITCDSSVDNLFVLAF